MEQYPIIGPDGESGTVNFERQGLYAEYTAILERDLSGYTRLYCHAPTGSERLGIFSVEQGRLRCHGCRSLRSLGGLTGECFFSVLPQPWRRRADSRFPQVLSLPFGTGLCYALKRQSLPEEALPFFCFFHPAELAGMPYYFLYFDKDDAPYFPVNRL